MSLSTQIALRFILDRSKTQSTDESFVRGFVSFIAIVSMAGLALGVTALLVVTSVMNGFERELKRALTGFHGHVLLFSRGEPIGDYEKYTQELKTKFPAITAVSPYVMVEGMLSSAQGTAGAILEGIDKSTFSQVGVTAQKISEGRLPNGQEIVLGVEMARKLHVHVGDGVVLTIPFAKGSDTPLVQKLTVVGLMKVGMFEYDEKYALVDLARAQKFLSISSDQVTAFKILTRDPETSYITTSALNEKYVYPLRAKDWSSLNRNLFYALRHEKVVIGLILAAIVLVAAVNVIGTLMMMVHDKKPQISMLKALGWTSRHTFSTFFWIGSLLSILGTLVGLALAFALCTFLKWKSIIDLPADIYYFSRLPVEIRPVEWAVICISTVLLAILSTLGPSFRVSRQSPVEGLRYE